MLAAYKEKRKSWAEYEATFRALLAERRVENTIAREVVDQSVLLCSEASAEKCHRRLVAEYLQDKRGDAEIAHL